MADLIVMGRREVGLKEGFVERVNGFVGMNCVFEGGKERSVVSMVIVLVRMVLQRYLIPIFT